MASGTNPNDIDPAKVAGTTHTGDLPDVGGASDSGEAATRSKGLADFERLERAFIDRVYGGNRRTYEADYPIPE